MIEAMGTNALIIITGIHRSGTSVLAHSLARRGVWMGSDLMNHPAPDNPLGHWEAMPSVRINDALLEHNGGAWNRIPARMDCPESLREQMRAFIASLRAHGEWAGWKDPRMAVTLEAWRPVLPAHEVVCCFRHPAAVAHSLRVRDDISLADGLEIWLEYARALMRLASSTSKPLWFDFTGTPGQIKARLERIGDELGLPPGPGPEPYLPTLHHRHEPPVELPPAVAEIYEELLLRAGSTDRDTLTTDSECTPRDWQEALAAYAAVAQRHERLIYGVRAQLARIEARMQAPESLGAQDRPDDGPGNATD